MYFLFNITTTTIIIVFLQTPCKFIFFVFVWPKLFCKNTKDCKRQTTTAKWSVVKKKVQTEFARFHLGCNAARRAQSCIIRALYTTLERPLIIAVCIACRPRPLPPSHFALYRANRQKPASTALWSSWESSGWVVTPKEMAMCHWTAWLITVLFLPAFFSFWPILLLTLSQCPFSLVIHWSVVF